MRLRLLSTIILGFVLCIAAPAQILSGILNMQPAPSGGGFTIVHATAGDAVGTSLAVTIPSTTAGDDLRVYYGSITDYATITDNKSGGSSTYTTELSYNTSNAIQYFTTTNVAAGITQVTVTPTGLARFGVVIVETSPTAPEDVIGSVVAQGYSAGGNTGAITTTHSPDAIIGYAYVNLGAMLSSTDCTLIGQIGNDGNFGDTFAVFYKTEATTGSYSCLWAASPNNNAWTFTTSLNY